MKGSVSGVVVAPAVAPTISPKVIYSNYVKSDSKSKAKEGYSVSVRNSALFYKFNAYHNFKSDESKVDYGMVNSTDIRMNGTVIVFLNEEALKEYEKNPDISFNNSIEISGRCFGAVLKFDKLVLEKSGIFKSGSVILRYKPKNRVGIDNDVKIVTIDLVGKDVSELKLSI